MKRVDVAVIGAGIRGQAYADYAQAHPKETNIVAVAKVTIFSGETQD